eukprot:15366902-Ditylum_brightwellii.AAC.1
MENVLQVLGFEPRVIEEEKAGESQHHSTAKEYDNTINATVADEGVGPDGSSDDTELLKSVENPNSNLLQQGSVTSAVAACIVHNEGSSGNKSFAISDQDDDNVSLNKISVCSGDVSIGDPENRLPHYLLECRKKKGDFCIDHVIKEANKILDCDSSIDVN